MNPIKGIGKMVLKNRGELTNKEGQTLPAVIIGGVFVGEFLSEKSTRANVDEMWECEITVTPIRKFRGHKYQKGGSTMDSVLTSDFGKPESWREQFDDDGFRKRNRE